MTKKALAKLNEAQRKRLEGYRTEYAGRYKTEYRNMARAYTHALADSGIVTAKEADALFIYATI